MKQIITYQLPSGGVAVVHPILREGLTIEQIAAQNVPEGVPYQIVDASTLPPDRYFREAWRMEEGQLVVDVEAAKDVQRDEWRRLRTPKLDALDLDFMRALEAGEPLVEIAAAKTALRDVTDTELSGSLADIKANIPAILL